MRLGGMMDEEYRQGHMNSVPADPSSSGENAPQETPPSGGAPTAPPETPTETPGPSGNPQSGQGGPPPFTPPSAPPAVTGQTGQGAGLETNAATGGLAGTFAQVGNQDFAKRFGGESPAVWFRNAAGRGGQDAPNLGRGGASVQGNAGGAIPSTGPMDAPSLASDGGGKSDEEWQRFMAEVARLRFGRGGA